MLKKQTNEQNMLSLNLKRGGTRSSGKPRVPACPPSAWPPLFFLANLVLHPRENPGVAFPGFLSQWEAGSGSAPVKALLRSRTSKRWGNTLFQTAARETLWKGFFLDYWPPTMFTMPRRHYFHFSDTVEPAFA